MGLADFCRRLFGRRQAPGRTRSLKEIFQGFKEVLAASNETLALMGDLEESLASLPGLHLPSLKALLNSLDEQLAKLAAALDRMSGDRWPELENVRARLQEDIHQRLQASLALPECPLVVPLGEAGPEVWAALGGKAANLARLVRELHLPVPEGAAASLTAYQAFMEQAPDGTPSLAVRLQERLAALKQVDQTGLEQAALDLRTLVLSQPLPQDLSQALMEAARRLAPEPTQSLVVRSSGLREDLAATFAGQYDSFLGVQPEEVPQYWRQVVASQFSLRSVAYFRTQGFSLEEAAMGVLLQRLVEAEAAGVMFTRDPEDGGQDRLVVSATWGLGPELAAGEVSGDDFRVARGTGEVLEVHLGHKNQRLVLENGRLAHQPVASGQADAPALQPGDLKTLAEIARILEDYFGGPQGVEWVKDRHGQIWVVQCRPLRLAPDQERLARELTAAGSGAEVLLAEGRVGAAGVGAGPVFHLQQVQRQMEVPEGVVLVIPRTTPQLAPVLPRVAALVADVGSPTGHLALVAREYGIPALVDTFRASEVLREGEMVTVDAYHTRVYQGRVEALLGLHRRPQLLTFPLYDKLRAAADLIVPLTLVDPRSPAFRPDNCRTYHDIAFFAHEKAMQLMFGLMDQVAEGRVPALRLLKLDTPLPLYLHLVDLGDGLASHQSPVPPQDIISIPMRALWRGISHPGISWAGPVPVDLGGFLHVLGQAAIRPPENFWDKTYAIVAANYVNYACRPGYHFQSVDSYVGPAAEENYLNFNFKGGAADEVRRIRRAMLISTVLERLGFEVERHKDVIRARYRKRPLPDMEGRLDLLGRLMAYVRQMDMLMKDDAIVQVLAERFLAGHYERPGQEEHAG